MNYAEQCLKLERCLQLAPLSIVASAIEPPAATDQEPGFWHRLVQRLVHTFARAQTLQVSQRYDRFGNHYWQAYDPATGRSTTAGSAAEIRAWLEERQYQK